METDLPRTRVACAHNHAAVLLLFARTPAAAFFVLGWWVFT